MSKVWYECQKCGQCFQLIKKDDQDYQKLEEDDELEQDALIIAKMALYIYPISILLSIFLLIY